MNHIKSLFEVDLRSMAIYRILFGFILSYDLITRMFWIKAHYTDWGILPRKFLVDGGLSEFRFSFHLMNGRVEFQFILFLIALAFAISFMLGYRTKISGFVSWILLLSLQNRAQPLLNSGDTIMKMMLFWSLFMPLAKVYSLDAAFRIKREKIESYAYFSLPNVFFLIQLCMMYWFSVVTKQTPDWMETQLAVYYALHLDQFAKPLGVWLRQFIPVLKMMTWYTLFIEIVGPLAALSPFKWGWLRLAGALSMIGLHAGFYLTMEIGLFPWICMAAWLAFFPSCFWDLFEGTKIQTNLINTGTSFANFLKKTFPKYIKETKEYVAPGLKSNVALTIGFLYIILYIFHTLEVGYRMPRDLRGVGRFFSVTQKWTMFANPKKNDGWIVVEGKLGNGSPVNPWTEKIGPVSFDKPESVYDLYKTQRWRKFLGKIHVKKEKERRRYFAQYLCRNWNSKHRGSMKLINFRIFFMKERTMPPGVEFKIDKRALWNQSCFKKSKKKTKKKKSMADYL